MKKTVKSRQEKRMKERKEKENLHPHQRSALVTDYNNLDSVTYPRDIACVLNIVTWCAYLLAQGITLEDKIKGGDRLAVLLYAQRMVNDACCRVCLTVWLSTNECLWLAAGVVDWYCVCCSNGYKNWAGQSLVRIALFRAARLLLYIYFLTLRSTMVFCILNCIVMKRSWIRFNRPLYRPISRRPFTVEKTFLNVYGEGGAILPWERERGRASLHRRQSKIIDR